MNERDVRKLLGDDAYDEIVDFAESLKRKGKSPDEIVSEIVKKFRKLERVVFSRVVQSPPIHPCRGRP
jgi:hypothetical protein